MDQRTRRQFVQTIETFFPRELCGGMEGYPIFQMSTGTRDSGLTTDFVCGPLKDAVESGEHVVKCVQMPHIQCKCHSEDYKSIRYVYTGFYVMLSNKNQIITYYPGEYYWYDMRSTTSHSWGRMNSGYDTKWMFLKLEGTEENVKRVIDFRIQEYMEKCAKSMEVISPQISPSLQRAMTFHLALDGNRNCFSQPTILHMMGYEAFLQSCTSLLRLMNSITPQQQRVVRQRQRVVKQSSDRIGRSMEKIRQEFRRLETEMKTLGELSSTLSAQKTFTVGQDGQFVSRPT